MTLDDQQLDDFAPEAPGSTPESAQGLISLDEIIARGIPIHWDEAVAVVEELCDLLVSRFGAEASVPGLEHVLVAADGALALDSGARSRTSPGAAGRVLHTLLTTTDVPVALRLFVTQSTAPEKYASLGEFAAGLAYFGKPGRADLIKAMYHRCHAATGPVRTETHRPPSPEALPPVADHAPGKRDDQSPKRPRRGRSTVVIAAGVAAALLVAAMVWIWPGGALKGIEGGDVTGLRSRAEAIIAGLGTNAGPRRPEETPPAAASSPAVATSPARRPSSISEPGTVNRGATRPGPSSARAATPRREPVPAPSSSSPSPESAPPRSAAAVDGPGVPEAAVGVVYSRQDADVQPPVLLQPQLPPSLMVSDSQPGSLNRMELLVAADGTVERVRLINGARMPDMMLLSGAKMWRFAPAAKDGEPVRYRTVISWAGLP